MINLICQSISSTSSSLPTINNLRKTQLDQLSLPSCQIMAQIWTQTDFGILCQKQLRLVTTKSNPVYCPEEPLWYWVGMVHTLSSETSSSPQIHHRRNSCPPRPCVSKGAMIQSNFWNGNLSFFIETFTFAIKSESSRVVSYILHLLYSV